MKPKTLLFCKASFCKRSVLPFKPSQFGNQKQSTTQYLFHMFLGPPFLVLQKWSFGDTFKIQWAPQSFPKSFPGARNAKKQIRATHCCGSWKRHLSRIDSDWLLDRICLCSDRFGSILMDCSSIFSNLFLNCWWNVIVLDFFCWSDGTRKLGGRFAQIGTSKF